MRGRLLHFLTRRDGSIAVEFAFIAPVMIGMFFGMANLAYNFKRLIWLEGRTAPA